MSITLSALQKQRRDTAANWTAENPTLLAGELGIESDTGKVKVGNGSTAWTSLGYLGVIPSSGVYPLSQLLVPSGTASAPSISFDGDTNLGIYRSATDQLSFTTAGTERLRIDATGQIEAVSLGTAAAPTFSFTGDPNTGIYSPGADQVAISTSGVETLNVSANNVVGQAGIFSNRYAAVPTFGLRRAQGTQSAPTVVDAGGYICGLLSGNAYDGSNYQSIGGVRFVSDGATSNTSSPGYITFGTTPSGSTTNSERLRITNSGLVGVGNSAPVNLLDVSGAVGIGYGEGLKAVRNQYTVNNVILNHSFTSGRDQLNLAPVGNSPNSAIALRTATGSTVATRVLIDELGNVGIGTTTAGQLLTVQKDQDSITYAEIKNANTTANAGAGLSIQSGSKLAIFTSSSAGDYFQIASAGTLGTQYQDFNTHIWRSGAGAERFRCDSSGRLLVGTSSSVTTVFDSPRNQTFVGDQGAASFIRGSANEFGPNVHLVKSRNTSSGSRTSVQSGDELGTIWFAGDDGSTLNSVGAFIRAQVDGTPGANDMPGRLVLSTTSDGASSPTERWRIDSSGSLVGVAGSAFVAPYVYNTTTATAANVNVDASGFLRRSTSSIKYKTNVETIQDQYADAILGCRPVWYQSTCEADKPDWGYWGFIAEEVAAIDPRLCFFKEEEDGTLEPEGVQYDRFVPHLLNLIKRQQQAIETLEAKVAALESE